MKLFLISQDQNTDYDTYDSAVVAAPNEETARNMNPTSGEAMTDKDWNYSWSGWCGDPADIVVTYLGEAAEGTKQGGILASFNAG